MFDSSTYKKRRQYLKQEIGEGIILLYGNDESGMNYADNYYPFRQDSSFLYYCGLDKAHMVLLIDIDNNREILFGDDPSIDEIVWTGPVPSLEELANKAAIEEQQSYEKAGIFLQENLDRPIHFLPPYRPEHNLKLQKWLNLNPEEISDEASYPFIKAVVQQRNTKTDKEISQIEHAVTISTKMHRSAMQTARIGMKEHEVMSRVHQTALENGGNLSFPIILSTQGQVLHNHSYDNTIKEGDMILCDSGAENKMHYAGDLTRTFPAGKEFTSLQRDLYNIVLKSQLTAVDLMEPGVLFKDVHLAACRAIVEGLKDIGLMKGDPDDAVQAGAHTMFFQCGLGHLMGLDTHDMENLGEEHVGYTSETRKSDEFGLKSLRLGRALEKNYVVTVEPGIYMIPELMELRKSEGKYTDFIDYDKLESFKDFGGIRIEDDYLITEEGSRLLGEPLSKKVEDVEMIRKKELQ